MPSALERQGDFSQTFDAQGRLINIRDPRKTGLACNAVTGGPGCFDGNIIPASMINPAHMQAMLKLMPLPEYDPRTTQGNYNYDTEEVIDIPEDEQRRPGRLAADAERQLLLHVQGLVAGSARRAHHGRALELAVVLRALQEHGPGLHRQLHEDPAVEPGVGHRLRQPAADGSVLSAERHGVGQGQSHGGRLHGAAVPSRAEPAQRAAARSTSDVPGGSPNFSYDSRLSDKGEAWLYVGTVEPDLHPRATTRSRPASTTRQSRNSEGKGGVGGGSWAGDFNFSVDTSNPLDTNYGYANALLGQLQQLHRDRRLRRREGQAADAPRSTCRTRGGPAGRLTVDYGVRFLWYRPWASQGHPRPRLRSRAVRSREGRRCSISRRA